MKFNKKEAEETIKALTEQVEFYKKEVTEQVAFYKNEVANLNSTIGGYKTSNENYKKHVKRLEAELLSTKESLREAIEKNEDCSAKNEAKILELSGKLKLAEKRVKEWCECYNSAKEGVDSLTKELDDIKSLPWYKKIFVK